MLHDVYAWRDLSDCAALRIASAAQILPPGAVISGWTAAWMHGVDVRRSVTILPEVTLRRETGVSLRQGVALRHALLPPADVDWIGGIPVTTPLRTAFDLARRPNLVEGVVGLDALLYARLIDLDAMRAYIEEHPRWRGVRVAARALELAEPKAESPMETRLRLVIVLSDLPRPEAQIELSDAYGNVVGRLDLGYRQTCRGYEYDGRDHAAQLAADHTRRNELALRFGWELRNYTGVDVYRRPQRIVAQVARDLGVRNPLVPSILLKWLSSAPE